MGACLITFSLDGKFTAAQAKEKVGERIQESANDRCYEDAGYSGDWNTIGHVTVRSTVFNSMQAAEEALCETIPKREAVIVRVKDIDDVLNKSKMYQRYQTQIREFAHQMYDPKLTKRQYASLRKKQAGVFAKRDELLVKLADKTTKEFWYVIGWAAE